MVINIQPLEGIDFKFNMKKPGVDEGMMTVAMDYCQSCVEELRYNTPEAYERLIEAVIQGDNKWFSKWPLIEKSWHYIDKLKIAYQKQKIPLIIYKDKDMLDK